MNDYEALRHHIAALKAKRDDVEFRIADYYRLAGLSWLESQRDPQLYDVSPMYMSAVMALVNQKVDLESEVARLERQLPCDEFIRRFGLVLHETYRAKYPINKDTTICDVHSLFPVWRYALPLVDDIGDAFDLNAPRPIIDVTYSEAHFETWGIKPQLWWRLAYAREIDTVFVQREAGR